MTVFEIIIPILLISLIGWLLVKLRIIQERERTGLSKVTFSLFIPVLLFQGTYTAKDYGEINISYALAFYIPVLALFFLSRSFFNKFMHQPKVDASLLGLGASYSNAVLVGIPVLLNYIGNEAIVPAFVIISIHSAILFTLISYFTHTTTSGSPSLNNFVKAFYFAFKNPLVLSLMLGILLNYFEIAIPDSIEAVIVLLSKAALPCALIVLGAALASFQLLNNLRVSLAICLFKLGILPWMVWGLASQIFQLDSLLTAVIVVLSSTPVGINVYTVAVDHQKIAPTVASSILLSTLISIFSIPIWLYMIQ